MAKAILLVLGLSVNYLLYYQSHVSFRIQDLLTKVVCRSFDFELKLDLHYLSLPLLQSPLDTFASVLKSFFHTHSEVPGYFHCYQAQKLTILSIQVDVVSTLANVMIELRL